MPDSGSFPVPTPRDRSDGSRLTGSPDPHPETELHQAFDSSPFGIRVVEPDGAVRLLDPAALVEDAGDGDRRVLSGELPGVRPGAVVEEVATLRDLSPLFDGDLRRFPGRNFAHGRSRTAYNRTIEALVDEYLLHRSGADLLAPLAGDSASLRSRYRTLVGRKLRVPRLQVVG